MLEDTLLPILVSGLVLGSLYVLMAMGLSLVWSTLGIFNFSHGILMTIGAYFAWQVGTQNGFGWGPAAGLIAGILAAGVIGIIIEFLLVRPFQGRSNLIQSVVITTLAAAIILENGTLITWGARIKQLPPLIEGTTKIMGVAISSHEALIVIIAPAILFALAMFLKYSMFGQAIRAVGQNRQAATLLGMDARVLYAVAFALSAGLAALAGILLGSVRFITPVMGNEPLLKAMIVTIFGGLGSLTGTIVGAYIIGLFEAILIFTIGLYWTPASLFVLMIIVLLVRPTGLFKEN